MDPYDRVPYSDHAYAESHPDRMAAVARLTGWEPPSLDAPRVLELGCARGGNLLPMAVSLPRATLVGIDRSARQIDEAREVAAAAGLSNVTFHAASFEDAKPGGGAFDYVVAHGVYSWVPPAARRRLLERIAGWLAPNGVAYVSLNVLPGWYDRMAARDVLRFAEAALGRTPEEARANLAWVAARVSPEQRPYAQRLLAVSKRLEGAHPSYVVHEYLEPDHHPVHVSTFLDEAEAAGLAYLGDAIAQDVALELLDDEARARALSLDVRRAQQLIDFVRNTPFRRAILVRAGQGKAWRATLDAGALASLRIASRLRPSAKDPSMFETMTESVQVPEAARGALVALAAAAPRALTLAELGAAAGSDVARELFDLWLSTSGLDLHAFEPPLAPASASERPTASPLARYHAARNGPLTNLWHQEVMAPEDVVRFVLSRLDGTRTREGVAREVVAQGKLAQTEAEDLVRVTVDLLAASGLLVSTAAR
jgi:SAM-dependent methyltransferase